MQISKVEDQLIAYPRAMLIVWLKNNMARICWFVAEELRRDITPMLVQQLEHFIVIVVGVNGSSLSSGEVLMETDYCGQFRLQKSAASIS